MTGIQDFVQNFKRLESVKCPSVFRTSHQLKGDILIIRAIWDNEFLWQVYRPGNDDPQYYKCCKTPAGYYIDYMSCYYMPTHDLYREYYDSLNNFVVYCTKGYIMTGISKKISPWTQLYNIDWVQCCRLGFGPPRGLHPPVTYVGKDGTPVCNSRVLPATEVPCLYQHQYRKSSASGTQSTNGANFCNST